MNRSQPGPRRLSARRLALLATTIAGLGAAALFVAPNGTFEAGGIGTPAQAQDLSARAQQLPQKPVGLVYLGVARRGEVRQDLHAPGRIRRRVERAAEG